MVAKKLEKLWKDMPLFLSPIVFTSVPSQHFFHCCNWVCMFPGLPKKAHRTVRRVAGVDSTLSAIPEDESISYMSSRTPVRSNKHDVNKVPVRQH